jgi:CRP/FNR family cyclic AMP-dependent transcriptional regulator
MVRAGKAVFDAQVFVANVGAGKTILEFQKHQNVFAQGDVADTVFYIQKGKVKLYCPVRAGQGGGSRDIGTRTVLW